MQANSTILRGALTAYYKNLSSVPLTINHTCGRKLHTITARTRTELTQVSPGSLRFLKCENNRTRAAGYLILSRNESTTTKIPPLSSEVFSRTAEATEVIQPVISTAAVPGGSSESPIIESSTVPVSESIVSSSSTEITTEAGTGTVSTEQSLVWENIPEPPAVPSPLEELAATALSANGEPTFASLGLGSWWPPGIVQQCLEFFHVTLGLPWWGSILVGTVCVRLMVFPLVVKSQRNAAKMHNNMPQMQAIQLKMTEARQTGNAMMAAKYTQDMMLLMKEKDISPFKSILVPVAMAPIFISFFLGLRKMANLPVESMREGGLWWFTDLTMADPYCILPLITSVTLWITMEVGVDGVQLSSSNHGQTMRYIMRGIPIIMFPLTMNFPAAILCYWTSTNAISLAQVSLLKIPNIRKMLKIEALRKHNQDKMPMQKKGFMASFKDSWTNVKISKEMEDRVRYDDISFRRAGKGPIPKTYKYDPTKVSPAAIQAKQKR